MKTISPIILLFMIIHIAFSQPDSSPINLGKGILTEEDSTFNMLVTYGLLYSSTSLEYDTVLWVEEKNQTTPLMYPRLSQGNDNVIQFKMVDEKNSDYYYEVFLHLKDSLKENYTLTNENAVLYAIKSGQMSPHPLVQMQLTGSLTLNRNDKKDYEVALSFNSVHKMDQTIQTLKFKGNFLLPSSKYRESDLTTPVAEKERKRNYRRNMQLAGVMVMLFLAIFFFD